MEFNSVIFMSESHEEIWKESHVVFLEPVIVVQCAPASAGF